MELYTSLVRLKQAMNNGGLPPMTPVPESVHGIIDPSFTIGLGALEEDAQKGLRCPVRGCGQYFHRLAKHLRVSHSEVGGEVAVKRALSIPATAKMYSTLFVDGCRARAVASGLAARGHRGPPITSKPALRAQGRRAVVVGKQSRATVGSKNLRAVCVAQLSHRMIDLHHSIGRSPTFEEFQDRYGTGVCKSLLSTFGTWNNAKGQCGLEVYAPGRSPHSRREYSRERVLAALSAWYEQHGSLPSTFQVDRMTCAPLMPTSPTILMAMGVERVGGGGWPEAMRRAASFLNIHGGRYGLPEKQSA